MDTLVLNKDGRPLSELPLSAISWQLAIKLHALDKITIMDYYDDWVVRSPSAEFKVPSIIMTSEFIRIKRVVNFSRNNVFLRDGYVCQYCHKDFKSISLSLDHVLPRSKGGKTNWKNIVTSCKKCNSLRGNDESILPHKMPWKPNYYELVSKRKKLPVRISDPSWKIFLDWEEDLYVLNSKKLTSNT